MTEIKQLDLSILKREQFENKRSYDNAVWYLEHLNDLVMLHNSGYILFYKDRIFIPELKVSYYAVDDAPFDGEDGEFEKTGEVRFIGFGPAGLIGITRCLKKGRIYVSKREAKEYLKAIQVVHKPDFHNFLDL
ncbi:hypothetical protein ST201phi2-1p460 [Pseudomonas phage 201phi2-1]|uniref:Uncharacterized protein n=1 Tax=Pseudomonas phage 201phi2-1 TaxID=198110 RepID=B3FJW8_BP201|nr:hypothetical protein ST201phi2-1p460 [Pseudomonas phage 201phi2-1]ABY63283.1 hypothetical protein 201phi2-1p460 [Pseudomonas phage 201phi2-1]